MVTNVNLEHLQNIPTDRLEHCQISEGLRSDLGLTETVLPSGDSIWGQVRVFRGPSNALHSANFTVVEVDANDMGHTLGFYPDSSASANDGGDFKLWGPAGPPGALGSGDVEAVAPSRTTDGNGVVTDHFTEVENTTGNPNNRFFRETFRASTHDLILLVPHGGGIEPGTSQMVQPFSERIEECSQTPPTLWECQGQWGGVSGQTAKRWHVTSGDIDPQSFPGLETLLSTIGPYQVDIPFRYAVSLHGFAWQENGVNEKGIIIGGRASFADKERIRDKIDQVLGDNSVAYAVVEPGNPAPVTTWNDWKNFSDAQIRGKGGVAADNIVNRLSPNDGTHLGRGGVQIELSRGARDTYGQQIAAALGDAFCELVLGAPDVYIRDYDGDTGLPHAHGTLWRSPDVVVKSAAQDMTQPPLSVKGGTIANDLLNQGQGAFAYVRAYNRDTLAPSPSVIANLFDSAPATLVHPGMWNALGTVDLGSIPTAPSGDDDPTVGEIAGWIAANAGHRCLVCLLADHAITPTEVADLAQNWTIDQYRDFIRSSRWAAWRNYNVEPMSNALSVTAEVAVTGFQLGDHEFEITIGTTFRRDEPQITLHVPADLWERIGSGANPKVEATQTSGDMVTVAVPGTGTWTIGSGVLPEGYHVPCVLELALPSPLAQTHEVAITQRHGGEPIGRVTWALVP